MAGTEGAGKVIAVLAAVLCYCRPSAAAAAAYRGPVEQRVTVTTCFYIRLFVCLQNKIDPLASPL